VEKALAASSSGEKGVKKEDGKKDAPKKKGEAGVPGLISIEDFQKVELRVAEIVRVEDVPKADKLYKLTILAPEERTIVAGVKGEFSKEELQGKKVIIVANLRPVKLRGVESHGMMLVAKGEKGLRLLTVEGDIEPGAKVS